MTRVVQGEELAGYVRQRFPDAGAPNGRANLFGSQPSDLRGVAQFLKEDPRLAFNFLNSVSAVDYVHYFELVYHLTSFEYNHSAVVKTRLYSRETPTAPSVVGVWPGADFQEREIYDLMGVSFEGHPNLKRIMLWEGFPGHPQRRDFEDVVKY